MENPCRFHELVCAAITDQLAAQTRRGLDALLESAEDADGLNTHQSEALVRLVAERCQLPEALGVKGKSGILCSMPRHRQFLESLDHRIRFVYTPKHCSWLNQVEIWFSILVRRLLKRGSFASAQELEQRVLGFIAYFNRVLAKPMKWTYAGRPLLA